MSGILLPFIVTQVAVATMLWLVVRRIREGPSLAGRLEAIGETTIRPARLAATRAERVRVDSELTELSRQLATLQARRDDVIPAPATSPPLGFALLALIWFEADSLVTLVLNLVSELGSLSPTAASFISPLIAASLFVAVHVLGGAAISFGAEHKPRRVLARARMGAVAAGMAALIAAWAVLAGRSFSDPRTIETVASWGLIGLTGVLALAGGFATLVVTETYALGSLEREAVRVERRKSDLERHRADVDREIQTYERSASVARIGTAVTSAILVAALVTHAEAQTAVTATSATPDSCEVLLDVSTSVNAATRNSAVQTLSDQMATVADTFGCEWLRVSAFSGDAPFNVVREVRTPKVSAVAACETAAPRPGSATQKALQVLYPKLRASESEAAVRECRARARQEHEEALRGRQAAIDAGRAAWTEAARTPPTAGCTALDVAVLAALRRSQHILVLTDGADTCGVREASDAQPPAAVQGSRAGRVEQHLIFLLLPSNGPDPAKRGVLLATQLEKRYPGSRVLFLAQLTPSMWTTLGRGSVSDSSQVLPRRILASPR